MLLLLALELDFTIGIADVRAAFLNAALPLDEVKVIEPPVGEEADSETVWLTVRALYGFRKSPQYFQETLNWE